jgi:hypothetical protein
MWTEFFPRSHNNAIRTPNALGELCQVLRNSAPTHAFDVLNRRLVIPARTELDARRAPHWHDGRGLLDQSLTMQRCASAARELVNFCGRCDGLFYHLCLCIRARSEAAQSYVTLILARKI